MFPLLVAYSKGAKHHHPNQTKLWCIITHRPYNYTLNFRPKTTSVV